jgi:hypothetical protein
MEAEVSTEVNLESPYEWMGVVTYLSIIKKHPELRDEILELRRIKNRGFHATIFMVGLICFLLGYGISMVSMVV